MNADDFELEFVWLISKAPMMMNRGSEWKPTTCVDFVADD